MRTHVEHSEKSYLRKAKEQSYTAAQFEGIVDSRLQFMHTCRTRWTRCKIAIG